VFLVEQSSDTKLYGNFLAPPEEEDDPLTAVNFEMLRPRGSLSLATCTDFSDRFHRSTILLGTEEGLYAFVSDTIRSQTPPTL